jgi:hypothetical protein
MMIFQCLKGNEKYHEESISLLDQYPVLRKMWDKKLEKKLLDPKSTIEEKKSALLRMAQRVPERVQFIRFFNYFVKSFLYLCTRHWLL